MLEFVDTEITYASQNSSCNKRFQLICDEKLPVGDIEKAIRKGCGKILEDVSLFERISR